MVQTISAITLATHDMRRAVDFYQHLGFPLEAGGGDEAFTTFRLGLTALNLVAVPEETRWTWWGRLIFHVDNVDEMYAHVRNMNLPTDFAPRDAKWGERYFHMADPDGHEISFVTPL